MEKLNKMISSSIVILILVMTIGYSSLNRTLNITGGTIEADYEDEYLIIKVFL